MLLSSLLRWVFPGTGGGAKALLPGRFGKLTISAPPCVSDIPNLHSVLWHVKKSYRSERWVFTDGTYLILQRHNRIIFGCVDMQNMVFVPCTKIIGNICKGRACSFRYSIINYHHIIIIIQSCIWPRSIYRMTLLNFSNFVFCNSPLCKTKHRLF